MAQTEQVERKLTAVLAADVVGYSHLMGADEAGTLGRLKALRSELVDPKIREHHGRVIKLMGDGELVEFASVVEAVRCAVEIQAGMAERHLEEPPETRIAFRIGVNIGDVIIDGEDVYGDGVNIAARLQALAKSGAVIVSGTVHDHVRDKLPFAFDDLGDRHVKNIARPVRIYRVRHDGVAHPERRMPRWLKQWPIIAALGTLAIVGGGLAYVYPGSMTLPSETVVAAAVTPPALSLPEKPSVAVLPFANRGGDARLERLSEGLTDDIITDLSRFHDLFVIARNSILAYKEKPADVRQIGRELGVGFILEGSVQAAGDSVRITAQLIDAASGRHLWAERYDRPIAGIFAVQDEITQTVASALASHGGHLAKARRQVARRKPPESLDAYDYYLLGVELGQTFKKDETLKAQELFERTLSLDPGFARAYLAVAWTQMMIANQGWSDSAADAWSKCRVAIEKAVILDDSDAEAYVVLGMVQFFYHDIGRGTAAWERALSLNANNADVLVWIGGDMPVSIGLGRAQEAVDLINRAIRLNPQFPSWYMRRLGLATYFARRYEDSIAALRKLEASESSFPPLFLAMDYAQLGREGEAARAGADVLRIDPTFSAQRWIYQWGGVEDDAAVAHIVDGVRKAGLPVCASPADVQKYPEMKALPGCLKG